MSDALRTGAARFQHLLQAVAAISDATCDRPVAASHDGRDYRAIVEVIETSLRTNAASVHEGVREGYLRAMADLLSLAADGCAPSANRDPLLVTAAAFAPPAALVKGDIHV